MVEKDKERPVDEPGPLLEGLQWGSDRLKRKKRFNIRKRNKNINAKTSALVIRVRSAPFPCEVPDKTIRNFVVYCLAHSKIQLLKIKCLKMEKKKTARKIQEGGHLHCCQQSPSGGWGPPWLPPSSASRFQRPACPTTSSRHSYL